MKQLVSTLLVLMISASLANADELEKIEYLLTKVASSNCVFIRNSGEHSAEAAEQHLRMKYRRAKKWVTSAESFITRIATKSTLSGKPYRIRCDGQDAQLTAQWLRERLLDFPGESAQPDN